LSPIEAIFFAQAIEAIENKDSSRERVGRGAAPVLGKRRGDVGRGMAAGPAEPRLHCTDAAAQHNEKVHNFSMRDMHCCNAA